ncbi:MAG TPA: chemotaxis protein CheA [Thermoanaerobaculia bacterium]|nr:chemotaxis protein CheA [Thermoanaerobaculia bacterium]
MSEIDLNELMATFVEEAVEDIAALESGLLALEVSPDDAEVKQELLRRAHTIKGNASCVGLTSVTTFAHAYEELLERIHENAMQADPAVVTLLLSGIDTFRRLISAPTAGGAQRTAARSLRVASEKLDRMLDLTGEIAIARGRVLQLLASADYEAVTEVEGHLGMLEGELQELVMRARMVPVGPLFRSYTRTVRDTAATHGKAAELVTSGEDVEVDTTAVEMLRDPLTHMIRNAIDHGIEEPEQRIANGKPATGTITLAAHHEAGSIVIRISDDGAGIKVDGDRLEKIFEPGFTTSESVTDLSGRGVGMDVVRRAVESLRGTINVETSLGEGSTFTIRIPLTLAVIDGFRVTAATESFIVPMDHVVECIELPPADRSAEASGVLLLRDEIVPYVRLRNLFGLSVASATENLRENVLVVRHGSAKAGLVVDELHGSAQAVIKPLGNYFGEVSGIAGSSILGNGQVALILDTPSILRNLEQEREHA